MDIEPIWSTGCAVCGDDRELVIVPAEDRSSDREVMCMRCGQARLLAPPSSGSASTPSVDAAAG